MKTILVLFFSLLVPLFAKEGSPSDYSLILLHSFSPEQKEKATFPLASDERTNWHYFPKERKGIRIDELDEDEKRILKHLLTSALGKQGQITAENIRKLEDYLYEKSGYDDFRDPDKYFLSIFGKPSEKQPWGFRYEGHHLSLNFTFDKGNTTLTTPFFFGTNPAEIPDGKLKGLRPLGEIEDTARAFAQSLHKAELKVRYTEKPPREILTGAERTVSPLDAKGISYQQLNDSQKAELLQVVNTIAANQKHLSVTAEQLIEAHFAWAGSLEKGKPHYFRIQTQDFLIEYANTQNNANHAHLVWRNFKNDFGRDLLKEHFQHAH